MGNSRGNAPPARARPKLLRFDRLARFDFGLHHDVGLEGLVAFVFGSQDPVIIFGHEFEFDGFNGFGAGALDLDGDELVAEDVAGGHFGDGADERCLRVLLTDFPFGGGVESFVLGGGAARGNHEGAKDAKEFQPRMGADGHGFD